MRRYSVFALAREGLRHHAGWDRAWASPAPKGRYDVVVVGAGGHGLATPTTWAATTASATWRCWRRAGSAAATRAANTTIIRSNYLQDPSAAIYEKSRSLYETLSQELNYNVMFSPRGVMMLAQTQHEVRGYKRTAEANALQGVDTEFISPRGSRSSAPSSTSRGRATRSWAPSGSPAAAPRATTPWPGAMPAPAPTWAWTSSSSAR
jgi:sarcosine oxidase subunit beta